MRLLPAGMQAHLDSGATTLCWCWRLTRRDGVVFGFTDHDRDVVLNGETYEAATGMTASEIEGRVGLSVDNLQAEGALSSARLNEKDLAAGLFDDAQIEVYRVNWQSTDQNVLMRSGSLGEISRGPEAFTAEIRGLAHYLQQPGGRLYQYACDADLGDARCTVQLNPTAYKATTTITGLVSAHGFTTTGLAGYASGWFDRGLLTFLSGANTSWYVEVKRYYTDGADATIELWQAPPEAMAPGDQFEITAGCDKQFSTCKAKFGNGLNFQGFPHIPGNDHLVSYPNRDDAANNGTRLIP